MDNPVPEKNSSTPNDRNTVLDPLGMKIESNSMPVPGMPRVSVDQLLLAGAHFGHLTQRWNPKMKRYIFMARNGIYLIDLQKTQNLIEKACKEITKISASGDEILFIGTKHQARDIVRDEALRCGCPYVTYRWLGGMLTNHQTIRRSLKSLESYEKMEIDGTYDKINKKQQLSINKSKEKLTKILGGIRDMRRLPGAIFVIDTKNEDIAVAEARKLGIPIFAIVDTNVNPEVVDFPIPANDDAFKSIWLISKTIADAILEGKKHLVDSRPKEKRDAAPHSSDRQKPRRSRRRRKPRSHDGGAPQSGRENKEAPKSKEE
jgi:small subunit ribosomal protein S2